MNSLDTITLTSFLVALAQLDSPLSQAQQMRLKLIGSQLQSKIDELDILTESEPILEELYQDVRLVLQKDISERFLSTAFKSDDRVKSSSQEIFDVGVEVLTASDSVNAAKQAVRESEVLQQLIFQLQEYSDFAGKNFQELTASISLEKGRQLVAAGKVEVNEPTQEKLLISDLGWSEAEAQETYYRLLAFQEDWEAPGMEAYDEL